MKKTQRMQRCWDVDTGSLIWVELNQRYSNDGESVITWWE